MSRLRFGFALLSVLACAGPATLSAQARSPLFRVFLTDGRSLTSFGEWARLDDRVAFSMPLTGGDTPDLQLVTVPARRVDWPRTERYAATVRAVHYTSTRAEDDFAVFSNQVAEVLTGIAREPDPKRRLTIAAARPAARWPIGPSSTMAIASRTCSRCSCCSTRSSASFVPRPARTASSSSSCRPRRRRRPRRCCHAVARAACRRTRCGVDHRRRIGRADHVVAACRRLDRPRRRRPAGLVGEECSCHRSADDRDGPRGRRRLRHDGGDRAERSHQALQECRCASLRRTTSPGEAR